MYIYHIFLHTWHLIITVVIIFKTKLFLSEISYSRIVDILKWKLSTVYFILKKMFIPWSSSCHYNINIGWNFFKRKLSSLCRTIIILYSDFFLSTNQNNNHEIIVKSLFSIKFCLGHSKVWGKKCIKYSSNILV